MRILYTGPLTPAGQTCEMRRVTLERLGHDTDPVDYMTIAGNYPRLLRQAQWRLRAGPMIDRYNRLIIEKLATCPGALWVDKGMFVRAATLAQAKAAGARLVHYSPDNYFLATNSSRHFWDSLPLYDLVVTTKSDNVDRLKARGARKVMLSGNAFDPRTHVPVPPEDPLLGEFACDVSFVGRWEPERERWLERVAGLGVELSIRGFHWEKARSAAVRRAVRHGPALGMDYARAICAAKINLGLLSKSAGDRITQRSIEIPACGGFMLAERTEEHRASFAEDAEAVYFDGVEELLGKIPHILAHDDDRRRIAAAGRDRCLRSDYSYDARLAQVLEMLGEAG